ncbi:MAG TPA: transcriptional regulator [Chitinophagales bacterium]|nr:transcriptional regulator [Chitinophagales bacterium]HMZ89361.1 transcriptional regulator [Chitinophagales bacterium]HNE44586.1 transcriptional regulator [Chitinophagales bacterium]HNF69559.1 transcriptional regulator [Chitinophagales bacterium]HNI53569.1 transcriptional regulator [Chitinophagales bacterium]
MIEGLNKEFDNRVRLGIMSILMVNSDVDFNSVKNLLQLTDGNLASHMSALEKAGYVEVNKAFVGKKPRTTYAVSESGKKAFQEHLNALEKLIKMGK